MIDDKANISQEPSFLSKVGKQREALKYAAVAAFLSYFQEHFLFPEERRIPGKNGLDKMLSPQDYPQLDGLGVTERQLIDPANGSPPVTVWEKKAEPGKRHYLLFHGQAGHWGDGGPAPKERYDNPNVGRTNGLEYMQAVGETGAGFTAVCLPGYGKTPGKPSEQAFNRAVTVVVDDLLSKEIPSDKIVIGSESLGCASALEAAVQMTRRGQPPAQVDMMNPFASMAEIASESFDKVPQLRRVPKFEPDLLDKILKHHFNNREKLEQLTPATTIHIGTSTKDSKIDHHHSDDLVKAARNSGLDVVQNIFPENNHRDWSPAKLLAKSIQIYDKRHGTKEQPAVLERLETHDYGLHNVTRPVISFPENSSEWQGRIAAADNAVAVPALSA